MKNLSPKLLVAVALLAASLVLLFLTYRTNSKSDQVNPSPEDTYTPNEEPRGWVWLEDETLGIAIAVPPELTVYQDLSSRGCVMPLRFGPRFQSSVLIFPEFSDCAKSNSLSDSHMFESYHARKLTVIPVNEIAEIQGIVKSRIAENQLLQPNDTCNLESIRISIPTMTSTDESSTVPVAILSECDTSSHALSLQYSPTHKKVVLIEAVYGYGEEGDFIVNTSDSSETSYADTDMYHSIRVLK